MSLKLRFKFEGRCHLHPRYNPENDGQSPHKDCPGCESLYVIFLYVRIARKRAESGDGMLVLRPDASKAGTGDVADDALESDGSSSVEMAP